jgi:uncharacterized protein (DUF2235 family)
MILGDGVTVDDEQNGKRSTKSGKKIIVLSDGTGNSAARLFKTNVWRLYQALDLSIQGRQVARYDDGVGSSHYRILAMLGGVFGWGLKRNVLDLYTFICRNHQPGDQIYAFGFSRGAFTVRVLLKFILSQGLVADFHSDDDLRWKAKELYRNFRRERKTRFGLATFGRAIRDAFFSFAYFISGITKKRVKINRDPIMKFIGVWDTVDAYGIPIDELKKGIDRYIWPLALEDRDLHSHIEKACHAISIDDERTTFHPLLWDESEQRSEAVVADSTDDEKLTQVFFAGVHANVGGGYPDDALSFVPLNWMMKEATKAGLTFKKSAIAEIEQVAQPHGRLYDSRFGLGSYYRYEPRPLGPPKDKQLACIPFPKVHESVLIRIALGMDAYAPLAFPSPARILVEEPWAAIQLGQRRKQNIFTLGDYGKLESSPSGYPRIADVPRGAEVLASIKDEDVHFKELTWDTVWWRRVAYFATVFVSTALIASPEYAVLTNWNIFSYIAVGFNVPDFLDGTTSFLQPTFDLLLEGLGAALPNMLSPWLQAFHDDPGNFLGLCTLLLVCIVWSKMIDRRISDRSFANYDAAWRGRRIEWFKTSLEWRRVMSVWSAIFFGTLLAIAIYVSLRSPACVKNSGDLCELFWLYVIIARLMVEAVLSSLVLSSVVSLLVLPRLLKGVTINEPRGFALLFSNMLRSSKLLVRCYQWMTTELVPALLAVLVVLSCIGVVNRFSFSVLNRMGEVCSSPSAENNPDFKNGENVLVFEFSSVCQPTHFNVVDGDSFTIAIISDDDLGGEAPPTLTDEQKSIRAQVLKLPKNSKLPSYNAVEHIFALPFRRVLSQPFFKLMVRVGSTDGQEYALDNSNGVSFKADRDAEMFLYLNNIVVGAPGLYGAFYSQKGKIKVSVFRESSDANP